MKDQPLLSDREILRDIHSKTNEMYSVVIGNPKANQDGLVHKVYKLEKAEDRRGRMYVFVSSISAGISFGIHKAIEFFNR